ncbi:sigma-70 family RNA polymerase sigma factor [Tessaracoccus sp. OH4464_COT-324]|uniref:sigma-70 family RNA polymerase sigma factor n=1 Tax=Tessaracoccus sp. OH4464_COT-324 TaxID=2491059 RepID=UPI000F63CA10|nr:sigma-70 family RNA polymerase sigma factor [Tessaracoccus sp. OH4464_COT-324]RRD47839.1 sigma-70 family RNA polymerase sigma factor [Tessaracoccus sp. OH4464_COT-324]
MKLDYPVLSAQQQLLLCRLVKLIVPARELLRHHPTIRRLWQLALIGLTAEQALWCCNLRLVARLAHQVAVQKNEDFDDLFQEGCIALRQAIRAFRPDAGLRLSTYAYDTILYRIRDVETTGGWVISSRHARRLRSQARATGGQVEGAAALRAVHAPIDHLADPRDPFEKINTPSIDFLELLDGHSQQLLRLRFGIGCEAQSHKQLAARFGVSASTISRWERHALQRARELLEQDHTVRLPQGTTQRLLAG